MRQNSGRLNGCKHIVEMQFHMLEKQKKRIYHVAESKPKEKGGKQKQKRNKLENDT